MNSILHRRLFLKGTAAAAALSATAVSAIGPIQRTGQFQFRLSLAGYSYRKYLNDGKGPMTLFDFTETAAQLGFDAIEPTSYYFPPDVTADFVLELKCRAHLLGLDISGVPIGGSFTHPPGEEQQKQFEHLKKWVDWSALLGAPTIRVFAGNIPEGGTLEQARTNCVANLNQALDYAASKGVFLALENHGGIVSDADGLLYFVQAIEHPWFGINLDTGNFRSNDPYQELARCAPYAVMVQFKVSMKRGDNPLEPADFNRILDILQAVQYRGYIVLEYEDREDAKTAVPRYAAAMQRALHTR